MVHRDRARQGSNGRPRVPEDLATTPMITIRLIGTILSPKSPTNRSTTCSIQEPKMIWSARLATWKCHIRITGQPRPRVYKIATPNAYILLETRQDFHNISQHLLYPIPLHHACFLSSPSSLRQRRNDRPDRNSRPTQYPPSLQYLQDRARCWTGARVPPSYRQLQHPRFVSLHYDYQLNRNLTSVKSLLPATHPGRTGMQCCYCRRGFRHRIWPWVREQRRRRYSS